MRELAGRPGLEPCAGLRSRRRVRIFRYVTTPLYFAYYQQPTVLIGLGLPGRPPFPGGFEVDATDPLLLDLLRTRAQS